MSKSSLDPTLPVVKPIEVPPPTPSLPHPRYSHSVLCAISRPAPYPISGTRIAYAYATHVLATPCPRYPHTRYAVPGTGLAYAARWGMRGSEMGSGGECGGVRE
eukprot:2202373-Rhodomonas_salina.1